MARFDVIATGRAGVDLYPEQHGVRLAEVRTFAKSVGGSPTNVAVQCARLGSRTAVVTKVGADGFGDYIRLALEDFGVDTRWVGTDPTLRTPLAFCEIHPPDDFPLLFYRAPKAPDMNLELEDLPLEAISEATVLWTTGTALSDEPSRSAVLQALARRASAGAHSTRPISIHDVDHRPALWPSRREAARQALAALEHSTVVVGNSDEIGLLVGDRDPEAASAALIEQGVDLAVIKLGAHGVVARTAERLIVVPPIAVTVVNGLGAGDAFGGALAHGLAQGWEIEQTLRVANAAGALAASRLACADDFGTYDEIEQLLASTTSAGDHPREEMTQ